MRNSDDYGFILFLLSIFVIVCVIFLADYITYITIESLERAVQTQALLSFSAFLHII